MTEAQKLDFLAEARDHGEIALIKSDPSTCFCRGMVTVGNLSIPMDFSFELIREWGMKLP